MRVLSYNILSGGLDDTDARRYHAQMELIRTIDPDILLMQEARGFLEAGGERLFETEADGHADRRTLAFLLQAGFVDVAVHLQQAATATVPTTAFTASEFVPFRCDYFLATSSLARRATRYEVVRNATSDWASDHYPILAEFARVPRRMEPASSLWMSDGNIRIS